jgi:hypothetical protein
VKLAQKNDPWIEYTTNLCELVSNASNTVASYTFVIFVSIVGVVGITLFLGDFIAWIAFMVINYRFIEPSQIA